MKSQPYSSRKILHGAAALVVAASIVSCGGDNPDTAEPDPVVAESGGVSFGLVTPSQAAELSTDEAITIIDVRTPEEFAEGHIEGAIMIDFYEPNFADEIAKLDLGDEYLIYCKSGNRSGQTFAIMEDLGFEQVYDLDGGVIAYGGAGLPLVN